MVATPPQTDTYSTALDIFDRTHPLRVDSDENLKVTGTFTFTPTGTQDVNIVGSISLPVTGAFFQATQPVSIATTVNVDVTNTVPVTLASTTITGNVTVVQPTGSNLHIDVDNFPAKQAVDNLTQLIPFEFDYINLTPSGTNPTMVTYKTGGASGTTVATLTLVYDANNNVETITRT